VTLERFGPDGAALKAVPSRDVVLVDEALRTQVDLDIAQFVQVVSFVVIMSSIVFGLTHYLLVEREAAVTALAGQRRNFRTLARSAERQAAGGSVHAHRQRWSGR